MTARHLNIAVERFPIAGAFVISRGAKTEAVTVVATIEAGGHRGRGECVPYARYGESIESVVAQIESLRHDIETGTGRDALQRLLPHGAARNALDCALWDLEAKIQGLSAFELAGLAPPEPVVTAYTLSLGTPEAMAAAARAANRPLLKLKLAGDGDAERLAAVRAAVPAATLIVDANEAWSAANLDANLAACVAQGVALIEQPLPAGEDAILAEIAHPVPLCADESLHDRADLAHLRGRYEAINIKLDKTGGLTEALALATAAEALGLQLMIGCMVASSLAMAPALLLAGRARYVDLDGPLLLARDRPDGLLYEGARVFPAAPALWG
ncbi:L-Ala-D/L-Glu epimerase [Methylovirgula ligni]|uniref:Dipeptide epimerase n=1 Tax=Methylovirgula ligni TaxID=569860 RepID=A0A3D9YXM8_9HYPH|nr:N-acetyl-D-Glu racemase DgcA [Methylovirgula ligni]QAY95988.1 L-Ala-D/L-Glu epimerase [Methylovirgula ligni]REF86343.1 L-alanine-DL-glutamate epimerase-like enolase superfamily enzyme [Methylovirgula ligni]